MCVCFVRVEKGPEDVGTDGTWLTLGRVVGMVTPWHVVGALGTWLIPGHMMSRWNYGRAQAALQSMPSSNNNYKKTTIGRGFEEDSTPGRGGHH